MKCCHHHLSLSLIINNSSHGYVLAIAKKRHDENRMTAQNGDNYGMEAIYTMDAFQQELGL